MFQTRISGPAFLTTTALTQYFAPSGGGATINAMHVENVSGASATFSVSIGTDAAGTRVIATNTINAGQVLDIRGPFTLNDGEIIQAVASVNSAVLLTIDGEAASVTFPLSVASSGRTLQTFTGAPFLMWGDAAWGIINEPTASDLELYLSTRRSQGFNTLIMQTTNSVKYVPSSVAPAANGAGGALPWSKNTSGGTWTGVFANHDSDWSTPVDAYWQWVGYVLQRAKVYGFLVINDWEYYGFNLGSADGWYTTIGNSANTQSVMQAFGTYCASIARQYNINNIIWSFGTDTFPVSGSEEETRILKMHDGWLAGGGTSQALAHLQRSSGSHDDANFSSRITIRGTYPGTDNASAFASDYARLRLEYAASPTQPVICVEANYSTDRTDVQMRTLNYQGWLSSQAGFSGFGQNIVASFSPTWPTEITNSTAQDMSRMIGLANSHSNAYQLVPRGLGSIGTLVTAGGGTLQTMGNASPTNNATAVHDNTDGLDWVAAAGTPDGSLLLAYFPDSHTGSATFDMTFFRGTVTANWFDPTNGSRTSLGTFSNTGTHAFTIPGANSAGNNDWVLECTA